MRVMGGKEERKRGDRPYSTTRELRTAMTTAEAAEGWERRDDGVGGSSARPEVGPEVKLEKSLHGKTVPLGEKEGDVVKKDSPPRWGASLL